MAPKRIPNLNTYKLISSINVSFSISAANFANEMDDNYDWDEDDDGPSDGGEDNLVEEEPNLPTVDSKSGRIMSKPRKSGFPLEWLLGIKQSGFSPSQPVLSKKKGKGKKFDAPEAEEEEYPENEEYDEEVAGDEGWDDEEGSGSRYPPINTKITITKVVVLLTTRCVDRCLGRRLWNIDCSCNDRRINLCH